MCNRKKGLHGIARFGLLGAMPQDAPKPAGGRLKEDRKNGRLP